MSRLRIALAQVDVTVGDLAGNSAIVLDRTARAVQAGADLVAFPEMALTGYPPEDLVLRTSFVGASRRALDDLASGLGDAGLGTLPVLVGYLDRDAGGPRNAAALLRDGEVVTRYAKHHLPNYGVFDEGRYFAAGDRLPVIRVRGVDVAPLICEDLWVEGGPVTSAARAEAGLLVCVNGSPYERRKDDYRAAVAADRAREAGATLAYVNLVGGQDELVFDGDSFVVAADGGLVARAARFVEELLVVDLDLPDASSEFAGEIDAGDGTRMRIERHPLPAPAVESPAAADSRARTARRARATRRARPLDEHAEIWSALVTGTRDYVDKNGFASVLLGLSGGIDSAVVATLAVDAVAADRVHTVALPSSYSSAHSLDDAADLAARQGTHHTVVSIAPLVAAATETLTGQGGLHGLAVENLQARARGLLLMALSNEHGHLVLVTGNKSELSVGFSTLYGDTAGGFAPIKDVPKSLVWELARWRNAEAERLGAAMPIPPNSIDKPPSAELAPGQLDTDRLPPYDILDPLLADYVDRDLGREELLARGYDADLVTRVLRLVDAAEYKRRQYPPGPKISLRAFGRDRRLPITSRWREPSG